MDEIVRFSFPLNQRMASFLALRDALRALEEARKQESPQYWLLAAVDLLASLTGDHGRKTALPELVGLLVAMQAHLEKLANEHPRFRDSIMASCQQIGEHLIALREGMPALIERLAHDSLITAYHNAIKKLDWLGHKPSLPQSLLPLWQGQREAREALHADLHTLNNSVATLGSMLHDYVGWEKRTAVAGYDQLSPERGSNPGLLIVGIPRSDVMQGIIPDITGNHLAIRVRFQRWESGKEPSDLAQDLAYGVMLVPIG